MCKNEFIVNINGINFYKGHIIDNEMKKEQLIFTEDENYRIDIDEDIIKACNRIYKLWYEE